MNKFEELKKLLETLRDDIDKFYSKGNSAAGTRLRKGMQDLKNLASQVRQEIQELKSKDTREYQMPEASAASRDSEDADENLPDDEDFSDDEANGGGPRKQ
jgi:hypothetical protein